MMGVAALICENPPKDIFEQYPELKERIGIRNAILNDLSDEDIEHYHMIVVAISETIRIMDEIDKVIDEHCGWLGAFVTTKDKVK